MPPVILLIVLIVLPLGLGGLITWAAIRRIRRAPKDDIEQVRVLNADVPRYTTDGEIVMRDLESVGGSRKGKEPMPRSQHEVVPESIAPVATPLKIPTRETKGVGGGFVKYFKFGKGRRKQDEEDEDEDKAEDNIENRKDDDHFENPDLYGVPSWEPKRGELEQPGLYDEPETINIPAPKPIYTNSNYGRYNASPVMALGDDGKAADVWEKINKRESLVRGRANSRSRPEMHTGTLEQAADGFEEVDLHGEPKAREKENESATDTKYAVGSDSDSDSDSDTDSDADSDSDSDSNDGKNSNPRHSIESASLKYDNPSQIPATVQEELSDASEESEGNTDEQGEVKLTFEGKTLNRISNASAVTYASSKSSKGKKKVSSPASRRTRHASFDDSQALHRPSRSNTFNASPARMRSISELKRLDPSYLAPHPLLSRPSLVDSGFTSRGSSSTSFERSFTESDATIGVKEKTSWSTDGLSKKSERSRPERKVSASESVAKPVRKKASKASVKKQKTARRKGSVPNSLVGYTESDEE
jgi:hypothetical protein